MLSQNLSPLRKSVKRNSFHGDEQVMPSSNYFGGTFYQSNSSQIESA